MGPLDSRFGITLGAPEPSIGSRTIGGEHPWPHAECAELCLGDWRTSEVTTTAKQAENVKTAVPSSLTLAARPVDSTEKPPAGARSLRGLQSAAEERNQQARHEYNADAPLEELAGRHEPGFGRIPLKVVDRHRLTHAVEGGIHVALRPDLPVHPRVISRCARPTQEPGRTSSRRPLHGSFKVVAKVGLESLDVSSELLGRLQRVLKTVALKRLDLGLQPVPRQHELPPGFRGSSLVVLLRLDL